MEEKLKWVEDEAKALQAFQVSCADALERQGSAFVNLVLAGAGGALAWQVGGMAGASLWLFALAALVLTRCLWARPFSPPANHPDVLLGFVDLHTLAELKRANLRNAQQAVDSNRARNDAVGWWLNLCRVLAAATPLVFIGVAGLVACLPG